jgi:transcription initiation factor TFIIH subunit 4
MSALSLTLGEYLEKLPGTTFKQLYQQPTAAFAIFRRMLPPLGESTVPRSLPRGQISGFGC